MGKQRAPQAGGLGQLALGQGSIAYRTIAFMLAHGNVLAGRADLEHSRFTGFVIDSSKRLV